MARRKQQSEAVRGTSPWLSRPMESGSHAFIIPVGALPGPCELKLA